MLTKALSIVFFTVVLVLVEESVGVSTPATTPPTTPPPILNRFWSTFSGASQRVNRKLDAKPVAVFSDVTKVHCISLCLQRTKGPKSKRCKSVNYAFNTCYILNTYVCDGERNLTDAPGYTYFDLVEDPAEDAEYARSKQCENRGRCSSKCLKFKVNKTPMTWEEAHNSCRSDQAVLAMPKSLKDHETLVKLIKKANILQAWIGLRKRKGIFYYDDGTLFDNERFQMWGPDQPNDSGGTQQCVQMMSEMEYMWNDFDCARPVGYVCQYVW